MTQIVTAKWAAAINGDWTEGGEVDAQRRARQHRRLRFLRLSRRRLLRSGPPPSRRPARPIAPSEFLGTGADATFSITAGTFAINSFLRPTSALFNSGHLSVAFGATLSFGDTGGTVSQAAGLWDYGAAAVAGTLQINAPSFSLFGSGVLTLTGKIVGALTGTQKLVNHASTIRGFGSIGQGGNLIFVNAQGGVVDAIGNGVLTINTGANTISNAGVIRTDGAGGLTISSKMQLDGQLMAVGAGALKLNASYVHGGGSLSVGAGGVAALKSSQLSLGGVVSIAAGGTLTTTAGDVGSVGADECVRRRRDQRRRRRGRRQNRRGLRLRPEPERLHLRGWRDRPQRLDAKDFQHGRRALRGRRRRHVGRRFKQDRLERGWRPAQQFVENLRRRRNRRRLAAAVEFGPRLRFGRRRRQADHRRRHERPLGGHARRRTSTAA